MLSFILQQLQKIFLGFPFSGRYVILLVSDAECVQQDSSACSLLISGPYVLGGFHVITKKGRGDAIAGISNDNKA